MTLYTSGYLGITDPAALEDLLRLSRHYESLTVYFNAGDRFHSKFFYCDKPGNTYCLFLGSSNVSIGGFADTGELNVQIRGKASDSVHRDIQIVMENLKKNRAFQPLTATSIKAYRKTRRPWKGLRGPIQVRGPKITLRLEEMPIHVIECHFTAKETDRIDAKNPDWDSCVSYTPRLRGLKRGDHFLCITKLRGQRPKFTTSRYIEHDRIPGVGTVAAVEDGDSLALSRLAGHLKVTERHLLKMKRLDIYGAAILRRDFPQTLG